MIEAGEFKKASLAYESMESPDEYDLYFAAIAYRGIDSLNLAVSCIKRAENAGYQRYDFNFLKGIIYTEQKMWVAASKAFEQAQYLDPKKKAAYYEAAGAYYQVGEWKKSRENYQKLLAVYPEEPLALFMECALAYEQEYYPAAYTCYSQNIKSQLAPSKYHAKSLQDLIKISRFQHKDYGETQKWWSIYEKAYPEDWSQAILKESFYWEFKKYDEAQLQSQKILAAADQLPEAVIKSKKYLAASIETSENYCELYRDIETGNWILYILTPSGFSVTNKYTSTLVDDQWEFTSSRSGAKIIVKNSLEIIHSTVLSGKF